MSVTQEKQIKKLHERSLSFSYFAHIFSYPSKVVLQFFPSSPPNITTLESDYIKLMLCKENGKLLSSPLHETSYTKAGSSSKPQEMADIAGFYKAFGLQVKTGEDRPDHIAMELEFMAFLLLKEEHAIKEGNKEGVRICRRAQRLFIKEHLGCWIDAFNKRLNMILPEENFYSQQGQALYKLVQSEIKRLSVKIQEDSISKVLDFALSDENPAETCPGIPLGVDARNVNSNLAGMTNFMPQAIASTGCNRGQDDHNHIGQNLAGMTNFTIHNNDNTTKEE